MGANGVVGGAARRGGKTTNDTTTQIEEAHEELTLVPRRGANGVQLSTGSGPSSTIANPATCVPGRSERRSRRVRRAGVSPVVGGYAVNVRRLREIFWVYIMASGPRGVLYVGMTSDLPGRALEHREALLEGFTKRYNVNRLVYFEGHDDAAEAARRERGMKRWRRDWKIELIEKDNSTWRDLFADLLRDQGFED